jgi:hypothetical protein
MLTPTSGFNLFSFHLISALQVLSTLAFLQQKRMVGKCFAISCNCVTYVKSSSFCMG